MAVSAVQQQVIARCQKSVTWFLENFAYTKHPSAGVIRLHPFKYQRSALKVFRDSRFSIFKKCRQLGISKITGAYAVWLAMMFSHKTILIVSKTDEDAMKFLRENVIFLFQHLPPWMQDLWKPVKLNDHEIVFPNGSYIRSLTSAPDVLRSNASSLNVIDEAAFIPRMGDIWAGGYSTLQHGGSVIVISTTNGVGGWYWSTWTDAEAGFNQFTPIDINWWDMDWNIEYFDPISQRQCRIAPTDDIRPCTTAAEIEKYGPFWSPWLEEQYRGLQERGETWKFDQEVLAKFVGSGNTILDTPALLHYSTTVSDEFQRIVGPQQYTHPATGELTTINFNGYDNRELAADEGMWVWKVPNFGRRPVMRGSRQIDPGAPPHKYVIGIDLATGRGRDYFGMQIIDVDFAEQVAEMMIHTIPRRFRYIVDYVGRWYNNALLVIERNEGGDAFIDEMRMELFYPNLWRRMEINDKPSSGQRKNPMKVSEYGHFTNASTKPALNKTLIDHLRADGTGIKIYSRRLLKQLNIYVRKKDKSGRDTGKTEAEDGPGNYDDLVMSFGLALTGLPDAAAGGAIGLIPLQAGPSLQDKQQPVNAESLYDKYLSKAGANVVMPMPGLILPMPGEGVQAEIESFSRQLVNSPIAQHLPIMSRRRKT